MTDREDEARQDGEAEGREYREQARQYTRKGLERHIEHRLQLPWLSKNDRKGELDASWEAYKAGFLAGYFDEGPGR